MEDSSTASRPAGSPIGNIVSTVKAVITDPAGFFRTMPLSGGFAEPLIFVVAMSLVSSIVAVPFWLLGVGPFAAFPGVLFAFVVAPLMTGAFSFVGAGIAFVLWRLLGSRQPYETAYRCAAYVSALSPVAVPLGVLPYVGELIMVVWGYALIVIASVYVHGIDRQKARLVFGTLALLFALVSLGAQRASRSVQHRTDAAIEQLEKIEGMSPEEAGKAVGEFMKGLQGAVDDKNKEKEDAE